MLPALETLDGLHRPAGVSRNIWNGRWSHARTNPAIKSPARDTEPLTHLRTGKKHLAWAMHRLRIENVTVAGHGSISVMKTRKQVFDQAAEVVRELVSTLNADRLVAPVRDIADVLR